MSDKKIEKEARTPDQMTQTLTQGFQWSAQHSQIVFIAVILFIVIGGGIGLADYFSTRKENTLQEKYYSFERQITEIKRKAAEGKKPEVPEATVKGKKPQPPAEVKPEPVDFDKSYAGLVDGLERIAQENPKSQAGLMSALLASEVLTEYQKNERALKIIELLKLQKPKNLLAALVLKQKGNLEANLNQCQKAIESWGFILQAKNLDFLSDEIKLKQAFCFEKINDLAQAEKIYLEISQKTGDQMTSLSKDAEKYLRLLKAKKGRS